MEVKNNVYLGVIPHIRAEMAEHHQSWDCSSRLPSLDVVTLTLKKNKPKQNTTTPPKQFRNEFQLMLLQHFKTLPSPAYLPCSFASADFSQQIRRYTHLRTEYSFKPLTMVDLPEKVSLSL